MHRKPDPIEQDACPFLEFDDPRCASHFKLSRLSEAFGDCFGHYRRCPNFYRLLGRTPHQRIRLTVHGRQLQPTGT